MRKLMSVMAAALTLGVLVPGVNAQSRERGRVTSGDVVRPAGTRDRDTRDRDNRDVRDRRNDGRDDDWYNGRNDRRDDDWDSDRNGKNGKGPAFCRSGAGHPVHGRAWCREKGFGLGSNNNGRWDRVTWDDVIFRRRPRAGTFGRDVLYDVLGGSVYNRLDAQRRYWGVNAPLVGDWNTYNGNTVLRVLAGGIPIAELVDRNNDRRVDYISLHRR
jgi:hypothetical protein